MTKPKFIGPAAHAHSACERCGVDLTGQRVASLELDQRTGTFTDAENIPPGFSQGWFEFGIDCARKALREHAEAQDHGSVCPPFPSGAR